MSANRQHTQPAKAKESAQAIGGLVHVGLEVIELNHHHLKPGSTPSKLASAVILQSHR